MATMEDSNDAIWNQSVCSKSWIDIVEEEERVSFVSTNSIDSKKSPLLRDRTNTKHSEYKVPVKDEPFDDESARDIFITNEPKDIKIQPSEVLPNFSLSLTKNKEPCSKENSKSQLSESTKDFLQDDISLSTHLNGFQLVSPCKVDHKTPTKNASVTNSISHYLKADQGDKTISPSQVPKRKLQTDESDLAATDEMLMPSPSKIKRQATPVKKGLANTPKRKSNTPKQPLPQNFLNFTPTNRLNPRKRSRESTPGSSEKKREYEKDPEVIARRQKQIEYGKNTIGYDRYRQLVPKRSRQKIHPKTPPLHLKFSRRAWDGMVKAWRQRLHFWDPPSEGGGNPECLDLEDLSETSSTEGSLPATPVQDRKRQCWQSTPGAYSSTKSEPLDEDDDDQGCVPLPPEDFEPDHPN